MTSLYTRADHTSKQMQSSVCRTLELSTDDIPIKDQF
jgi:hypothetical protein